MPDPTIERAARAVSTLLEEHDSDYFPHAWEAEDGTTGYEMVARAVLRAIREPSESLLEAGEEYINQHTGPIFEPDFYGDVSGVWQAMIDAALAE